MAFGYFMNINTPLRQTFTLCNKLARKVQRQLGLKLDNAVLTSLAGVKVGHVDLCWLAGNTVMPYGR